MYIQIVPNRLDSSYPAYNGSNYHYKPTLTGKNIPAADQTNKVELQLFYCRSLQRLEPHRILVKTDVVGTRRMRIELPFPGNIGWENELPWRMLYLLLAALVIAASGQAAVADRARSAPFTALVNLLTKILDLRLMIPKRSLTSPGKIPEWTCFEEMAAMSGVFVARIGVALFTDYWSSQDVRRAGREGRACFDTRWKHGGGHPSGFGGEVECASHSFFW